MRVILWEIIASLSLALAEKWKNKYMVGKLEKSKRIQVHTSQTI